GYRTASFQSNPHPREEFGFAHGFDLYHFSVNELAGPQVQQFEGWVRQAKHEPFFAFIHQIDPHGPYTPSARDFLDTHGMLRQHAADRVSREDLQRIAEWTHAYEMTGGDALDIAH